MIIYSVSVNIEESASEEWLLWMQRCHILDVMATGCFESFRLSEVSDPPPQEGTRTFNVQYDCPSLDKLRQYQEKDAPALQAEHTERYKDRFHAFRTILNKIAE